MAEMILKDYYDKMSDEDKIILRSEWLEKTALAYPTFYRKLMMDNFSRLEEDLFFEIYTKMGYAIPKEVKDV